MLFPTVQFGIFFPIVFIAGWLLRPSPRHWKLFMIAASYVFYAFAFKGDWFSWDKWKYPALLGLVTVVNQVLVVGVFQAADRTSKRWWLWAAVAFDLGALGFFKYYNFGRDSMGPLLAWLPAVQVILPPAISFYIFQALSYVIDAYRDKVKPTRLIDFATYLSFFPHLVAGPIVRASEFLPQLREKPNPRHLYATHAFRLIVAGMFKKVVISSYMASAIVDPVFEAPNNHSALEVLFAMYAYAIQIFADFSGYTDIAIGIALLLGIRFPKNFDAPYVATSLQDFWRRWHMSLSRWLRDYLYISLGGNRTGIASKLATRFQSTASPERLRQLDTYVNLMLVMLLGGLWHGAAWRFVIWGGIHGVGLAAERVWLGRQHEGSRPRCHGGPVARHVPYCLHRLDLLQSEEARSGNRHDRSAVHRLDRPYVAHHAVADHHDRADARRSVRSGASDGGVPGSCFTSAGRGPGSGPGAVFLPYPTAGADRCSALHLLPVLMAQREREHLWSAGDVLTAGLLCYIVAALLNSGGLLDMARRMPADSSMRNRLALPVAEGLHDVSTGLGFSVPAERLDAWRGREAQGSDEFGFDTTTTTSAPTDVSVVDPGADVTTPTVAAVTTSAAPPPVTGQPSKTNRWRVYIAGDSLVRDWGEALQRQLGASGIFDVPTPDTKAATGLVRPDSFDWPKRLQTQVAAKVPNVVVAGFGGNDGQSMIVNGKPYAPADTVWQEEYARRVGATMDFLAADNRKVVWVGTPMPPDWRDFQNQEIINKIYAAEAEKRPDVTIVDTWALFAGPDGLYAPFAIDTDGREKVMRQNDGFHFNVTGANRLADEINRVVEGLAKSARCSALRATALR